MAAQMHAHTARAARETNLAWCIRLPIILNRMRFLTLLAIFISSAPSQDSLRRQIRAIAVEAHGTVSVACSLPGSALNCDLNPRGHPPMQSVFKAPLALAVLHRVEQGALTLDQPVRFLPEDRILPHAYSPLQDAHPAANVDVPLRELLRLAVSLSDNVAADILLRLTGGPRPVAEYIAALGITGFHLQDGEHALHREMGVQYRNWFESAGAVQFLRLLNDRSPLTPEHTRLLLSWMDASVKTGRLNGDLPRGTPFFQRPAPPAWITESRTPPTI
jgi:beta-lactamase class A